MKINYCLLSRKRKHVKINYHMIRSTSHPNQDTLKEVDDYYLKIIIINKPKLRLKMKISKI